MKQFLPLGLFLAVNDVLAHPGHGRPGWVHFHESSDGLLLLVGLAVIALLCWAWKK